jgi:hypothetical protein
MDILSSDEDLDIAVVAQAVQTRRKKEVNAQRNFSSY